MTCQGREEPRLAKVPREGRGVEVQPETTLQAPCQGHGVEVLPGTTLRAPCQGRGVEVQPETTLQAPCQDRGVEVQPGHGVIEVLPETPAQCQVKVTGVLNEQHQVRTSAMMRSWIPLGEPLHP